MLLNHEKVICVYTQIVHFVMIIITQHFIKYITNHFSVDYIVYYVISELRLLLQFSNFLDREIILKINVKLRLKLK